jgi:osmotically-inducible protein OsmY
MLNKYPLIFLPILLCNSCIAGVSIFTIASSYHESKESLKNLLVTGKIINKLNNNTHKFNNLHVNVDDKRVLLSGRVNSQTDLLQAKTLIWKINEVEELASEVRTNKDSRNYLNDLRLASIIKLKLILDKNIFSNEVNIEVYNRQALLFGTVQRASLVKQASLIASKVKGVKEVTSHLRIAK